jgi:hypothetical protein
MKAPLVLLTALFIASAHQTLSGETFGDWTYSVSGSQATITGYSGDGGAVDIPALVNEISVVKVGDDSSSIFGDGNTTVTSVTIPDSVTSIGVAAFSYCTSLTNITIPDSVTSIGEDAFHSSSLTSITIPDSVTSIGDYAFAFCSSLASVTIGNSVTSIGGGAFYYCTSLTSITIPDSVMSIGEEAFSGCTNLTSITVDAGNSNYSSVDGVLFNKLQTLLVQYSAGILDNSYIIPENVTSIGDDAFSRCTNLTSITIPDSVTSIGDYAFYACTSLTSITISDSVTSIGDYAFYECTNLTSVTIGNSVTSIGERAFNNISSSLTSITVDAGNSNYSSVDGVLFNKLQTLLVRYPAGILDNSYIIPDNVTSIGERAFDYCTNLTSITIPDSVTSIGVKAFLGCFSLTSITIPDSVTSIGDDAFTGCSSLTSVTLPATLFVEENYSDYSLSAEQVRVEKTSVDVFVANAETVARTTGQTDVTSDPATYSLYTASDVLTAEAASRTLGQQDVTVSPSAYDLHTSTELAEATAVARTIVNVSARVNLGAEETVIPGFVVLGESKQLLIRAIGPKLADLGVPSPLPDPTMTIYRTRYDGQPNDVVAIIDDWKADGADVAAINAAMATAGAFPLEPVADFQGNPLPTDDTKSAATLITLSTGVYTVVVTSADGGEGDVLVEAYEVY